MKRVLTAFSPKKLATDALRDVLDQLEEEGGFICPLLLIFSSDCDNFGWYSKMLANSYDGAVVIGTTSHMMYTGKRSSMTGLSVMAIMSGISVTSGVLQEASRFPGQYKGVIQEAYNEIGTDENTVCLEFNASEAPSEELVMDTFGEVLRDTKVRLIGCTAAKQDSPKMPSAVSLNGVVYMDAAVFALVHNENGAISIVRENIFNETEHSFVATDVDCSIRRVYEFDHVPASAAVAKALKIQPEDIPKKAFYHPLGRKRSESLSVMGIDKIHEDGSMSFFTRIYKQTRVYLLRPVESLKDTWKETAGKVHKEIQNPSFSFVVSCYSRTKYFLEIGENNDFTQLLDSEYGDYIGVSVHGEQMDFEHLNQTMLIVAFE